MSIVVIRILACIVLISAFAFIGFLIHLFLTPVKKEQVRKPLKLACISAVICVVAFILGSLITKGWLQ